jgi:hypothetical protein
MKHIDKWRGQKLQNTRHRGLRYKTKRPISTVKSVIEVDALALPYLRHLLSCWLPNGKIQGDQYIALNPTRDDRNLGSFQINIKTALWADFATDDKGKGAFSIVKYLFKENEQDTITIILTTLEKIK